jgi:hypothetical protein
LADAVLAGFVDAALAGFAVPFAAAGFACAVEPDAGLAGCGLVEESVAPRAASLSLAFFCCTWFMVLCTLLTMAGFCAHTPPVIIAAARMPVVSFIAMPTCSPPP